MNGLMEEEKRRAHQHQQQQEKRERYRRNTNLSTSVRRSSSLVDQEITSRSSFLPRSCNVSESESHAGKIELSTDRRALPYRECIDRKPSYRLHRAKGPERRIAQQSMDGDIWERKAHDANLLECIPSSRSQQVFRKHPKRRLPYYL